ncbi:M23 family metallopeptidase [Aquimarina atlantica]|uniref:M23 family metallopeptidase n=1 Tax=Aquimarina atlantica TaxID=1317122 RepID=UPI000552ECA4|nr:M23 family metallopeptidase [Aquimarina atlantica]
MNKILVLIIVLTLISCKNRNETVSAVINRNQDPYQIYTSLFKENPEFIASDFDYPIGKPNAEGYYNAQKFRENNHLGDDWNGVGGGNTDLGDPIYTIANGYVSFAKDIKGGWGNVIRVIHRYKGKYYESVYAHCDSILVKEGDFVKKGALIATIGNANGIYLAHLHLEIRDDIFMDIGGGYANDRSGYLDPTKFINNN